MPRSIRPAGVTRDASVKERAAGGGWGSPKRSLWKTGSNFILALSYGLHFPTIT